MVLLPLTEQVLLRRAAGSVTDGAMAGSAAANGMSWSLTVPIRWTTYRDFFF